MKPGAVWQRTQAALVCLAEEAWSELFHSALWYSEVKLSWHCEQTPAP
jgi:hypothetical protein